MGSARGRVPDPKRPSGMARVPLSPRLHSFPTSGISFAPHVLESGSGSRTVQKLLGQNEVKMTMISTHVLNRDDKGVRSPVDALVDRAVGGIGGNSTTDRFSRPGLALLAPAAERQG